MTTPILSDTQVNDFDYVIVGGGTAGCVIASRLSEYLPDKKILLIEAGPSDFMDDRVLQLKDWLKLLGGELDYDYGTTEQPNGKSTVFLFGPSGLHLLCQSTQLRTHCTRKLIHSTLKGQGSWWMLKP
jgi:choline dehydrogenase-like flavoprotein